MKNHDFILRILLLIFLPVYLEASSSEADSEGEEGFVWIKPSYSTLPSPSPLPAPEDVCNPIPSILSSLFPSDRYALEGDKINEFVRIMLESSPSLFRLNEKESIKTLGIIASHIPSSKNPEEMRSHFEAFNQQVVRRLFRENPSLKDKGYALRFYQSTAPFLAWVTSPDLLGEPEEKTSLTWDDEYTYLDLLKNLAFFQKDDQSTPALNKDEYIRYIELAENYLRQAQEKNINVLAVQKIFMDFGKTLLQREGNASHAPSHSVQVHNLFQFCHRLLDAEGLWLRWATFFQKNFSPRTLALDPLFEKIFKGEYTLSDTLLPLPPQKKKRPLPDTTGPETVPVPETGYEIHFPSRVPDALEFIRVIRGEIGQLIAESFNDALRLAQDAATGLRYLFQNYI